MDKDTLELSQFYPTDMLIENIETDTDTLYIDIKSKSKSVLCPCCGKTLKNYHAVHRRKVQDLPILGKKTILRMRIYEYNCDNPECERVSVTESFEDFLSNYCRMTTRLIDLITDLALETSCEGASRILNSMNIKISGDTVIRTLIKRFEIQPDVPVGNCIGVDDFSFKKRYKYGTIIVDEATHKPVAVLDGRDGTTLKEWLANNQHVTAITRDRASAYAKAIEEVLPDAMQIADRFHLHQNLLVAVNKVLSREIPASNPIPKETNAIEDTTDAANKCQSDDACKKNAFRCG